ncbi:ArsR/SmtB family transcription factor [Actinopolymorpha pittospori]|uniref:DNA-binding transcriptional ArsR family regulator n=1 Tax=Actinopolymorpha pittospori TaxID=648752 RepID=A0A927N0X1_9ACTN|nr:winged helix-turn-helix domain-containing protein [Actinopolymorpha pittospori]MBE1606685.1 DNA-binding transcriptional ArsR family regulator [Actinopolymorpha pittospori]
MLRIHFTGNDLARIRITEACPLWETVLSLRMLRNRSAGTRLDGWRRQTRVDLRPSARILLALCPPDGYFAEFLMPGDASCRWEDGVEAVMATPRSRLEEDISVLAARRRLPAIAGSLAAGEADAMQTLGETLCEYHRIAITPYWERIQARVAVERAFRLRTIAEGGVELLLSTLATAVRWNSGVLELRHTGSRELRLEGRGLILAPSVFCGGQSVALERPEGTPVVLFPVSTYFAQPLHALDEDVQLPGALSALLGPTRAAALSEVADGATTTELARRLGVTLSTASEHAKVLREAGLITTGRMGRQAVHAITPLGTALSRCREDQFGGGTAASR